MIFDQDLNEVKELIMQMYEGKVSDGGESKHRGFKAENAKCVQEFARPGWLEESGRRKKGNEIEESGKNWMVFSQEKEEEQQRRRRSQ